MKRFLLFFLAILSVLTVTAFAATISPIDTIVCTYGDLTCTISDNEVTVIACEKAVTYELWIPQTIEGYPVTKIGNEAFLGCKTPRLVVPEGVVSIGEAAFKNCTKATEIVLPSSITEIGKYAFYNCQSMKSISIPNGVTILEDGVFQSCSALTRITIPNNVTVIRPYAFSNCMDARYLTIGTGVEEICENAFSSAGMREINIPSNVKTVGASAFKSMSHLVTVNIEDGVESLAASVFSSCKKLLTVTIGNGITAIPDSAFSGCDKLTTVNLPNGLLSIGSHSFSACFALATINLPESLTTIGRGAFSSCTALANFTLPEGLTYIGEEAFASTSAVKSIVIPISVSEIATHAIGYTGYPYNKVAGFTIYGYRNTAAEEYATANGFTFVASCLHKFGNWEITTAPTCEGDGEKARKCTLCDLVEAESIPGGHDYHVTIVMPFCLEGGYTSYDCKNCEYSYVDSETDPLGHDYAEVITPPSCTEGGYTTHTCTRCEDTYVDGETKALGHVMGEWEIVVEPTCERDGIKTKSCTVCDETEVETIPATGHDYRATVTEPTCTKGGYTTHVCANCGDSYVSDETEALGHSFGEWITDIYPTFETEGKRHRECAYCPEIETEILARLEEGKKGAIFTLSSEKVKPGGIVKLTLSLKSDILVNSIAISDITYDRELLEFVGFGNYEHMADKCILTPVFDEERECIVIALAEDEEFDGDICTIEFRVKEDAPDCTLTISATPLAKRTGAVLKSELNDSLVTVYTYIKGDINGDEEVDLEDAVYLFCHSMLPDYYPINYMGVIDLVPDGSIDVADAIYLFNYSMLPDLYPIS